MTLQLKKFYSLQNDIIFVDGLWGTGKSLLNPILNNMLGVEMVKMEMMYEYTCIMRHLEQLSPSAASFFLQSYADDSQYNNIIGRHINLRWNDASGLANNPNKLSYIMRLFSNEGAQRIDEINNNNIALNIMSHMIMLVADPLFDTYGDRLKLIEVVRHPLYMVKHWYAYLQRFDSPRELTVCIDHHGSKVPWFAVDWADEFVKASLMDRVLLSIDRLSGWLETSMEKAVAKGNRVLTLSFESLTMNPTEPLRQLETFLERAHHPKLASILRKEKIPRRVISHGRGHSAYGWVKTNNETEEQAYANNLEFVRGNGSPAYVKDFLIRITKYNDKYPNALARYQS